MEISNVSNTITLEKDVNIDNNIDQLKKLVDLLEEEDKLGDGYHTILKNIEGVIHSESKVITESKRSDIKLKHYDNICKSILSIISAANI